MKLNTTPRIAADASITREFRDHAQQVNLLAEGRISAAYNAQSAAPTTGQYAVGDFVRNSAPAELGTTPNKYVIFGWICVDDDPLTFVQCRFLTGN